MYLVTHKKITNTFGFYFSFKMAIPVCLLYDNVQRALWFEHTFTVPIIQNQTLPAMRSRIFNKQLPEIPFENRAQRLGLFVSNVPQKFWPSDGVTSAQR